MKMYKILIYGLLFISFIFNSSAQPDGRNWENEILMSISKIESPKASVINPGCEWIPPFIDDYSDVDGFRSYIDELLTDEQFQIALKAWKIYLPDQDIRVLATSLDALSAHIANTSASYVKLVSEFSSFSNKQKWVDDLISYSGFKININGLAYGGPLIRRHGIDLAVLGRVTPPDGSPGTIQVAINAGSTQVNILTTAPNPAYADLHPLDQIQKYWDEINKPHIDDLIANGEDIRFIHDPTLPENKWNYVVDMPDGPFKDACIQANLTKVSTYLKFEHQYLESLGYSLDPISGLMKIN